MTIFSRPIYAIDCNHYTHQKPAMTLALIKNGLLRIGTSLILLAVLFLTMPAAAHTFMDHHAKTTMSTETAHGDALCHAAMSDAHQMGDMDATGNDNQESDGVGACCQSVCTAVFLAEQDAPASKIILDGHVQLAHLVLSSHDPHDFLRPPNT